MTQSLSPFLLLGLALFIAGAAMAIWNVVRLSRHLDQFKSQTWLRKLTGITLIHALTFYPFPHEEQEPAQRTRRSFVWLVIGGSLVGIGAFVMRSAVGFDPR